MNDKSLREISDLQTCIFDQTQIARYTPEERQDYEDSLKVYRDLKNVLDTAELKGKKKGLEEGRKEGRKEGREEGRKESRIEIAKSLKTMGLPLERISEATGLTEEELQKL